MFNLVLTTHRHMESEAVSEMCELLEKLGDDRLEVRETGLSGLLTCNTSLDPIEVVQKIKTIVQDEPWRVRYVLRLIPIDTVVNTDLGDIKIAVRGLAGRIMEDQTFRITVEKRRNKIKSMEIIESVAPLVDRKVSLEGQDWTILIEVVGKETGVSVIRPEHVFSSVKVKRELPQ